MKRLFLAVAVFLGLVQVVPLSAQNSGDDCMSGLASLIFQSGLPREQTAEILGCRQLADGRWVEATVGDTRSFREHVWIDPSWEPALAEGSRLILEDIRAMVNDRRFTQWFVYDIDADTVQYLGAYNKIETVSLSGERLTRQPDWAWMFRNEYDQAAGSFLLDPNNRALAAYVLWYVDRRDSTLLALSANMPLMFAESFRASYLYDTMPWPWQLADAYTIETFLIWLAETNGISLDPQPTPTSPPARCCGPEGGTESPLFVQVTDQDGALLGGACVLVRSETFLKEICDNDPSDTAPQAGVIRVNVYPGTYFVAETSPPSGYGPIRRELSVVVNDQGGTAVLVHREEEETVARTV